jgi:WD40 repeat protein
MRTRAWRCVLEGNWTNVGDVAFSLNGRLLASAVDYTLSIWNVQTGALLGVHGGHTNFMTTVAF